MGNYLTTKMGKKLNIPIKYKDYNKQIIDGIITEIVLENKSKSIIWYRVKFLNKAFLVEKKDIIFFNQLKLDI